MSDSAAGENPMAQAELTELAQDDAWMREALARQAEADDYNLNLPR